MAGVGRDEATHALERELAVLMHRLRQVMGERGRLVHPEVNVAGYSMLMTLREDARRPTDLAEQFALDKGAVSRMMSHFEELGLVERTPDPADGRAHMLTLTDLGRDRLDAIDEERRTRFQERIADWSTEDLDTLVTSIRRYNDAIG